MSRPPKPEDIDALDLLIERYMGHLTKWEQGFLDGLQDRMEWTPSQQDAFDKIWDKVVVKGRRS